MKKASITEAKNNLSALIDSVKGGSPVLIVDRGRPVARLEPVNVLRSDDESRLSRLVRDGILRPARRSPAKELFAARPPRLNKGVSAVRALLDDRRPGLRCDRYRRQAATHHRIAGRAIAPAPGRRARRAAESSTATARGWLPENSHRCCRREFRGASGAHRRRARSRARRRSWLQENPCPSA